MLERLFFELVEEMEDVLTQERGDEFLDRVSKRYGLSHAAYLGVNLPFLPAGELFGVTTYCDKWAHRYVSKEYVNIDPIVRRGLGSIIPYDWSTTYTPVTPGRKLRNFLGEAQEFGIGRQGLSFPIHGLHGETALFSINSHASDDEWTKLKRNCMRDFQVLAYHFHNLVLDRENMEAKAGIHLTPRELECLRWSAAGKSSWETGMILSISRSTVDYHVDQARVKLDSVTRTQAVAKAVRLNMI